MNRKKEIIIKGKVVRIVARKETIKCLDCHKENEFFYLVDEWSYGLALYNILDGKGYAYVNLIEDKAYEELEIIIKKLLEIHNITMNYDEFVYCLQSIFGVTCDMIGGEPIDTELKNDQKCLFCGSCNLDNYLSKPEELEDIIVPYITHDTWNTYSSQQKFDIVKEALIKKILLRKKFNY